MEISRKRVESHLFLVENLPVKRTDGLFLLDSPWENSKHISGMTMKGYFQSGEGKLMYNSPVKKNEHANRRVTDTTDSYCAFRLHMRK